MNTLFGEKKAKAERRKKGMKIYMKRRRQEKVREKRGGKE